MTSFCFGFPPMDGSYYPIYKRLITTPFPKILFQSGIQSFGS